MKFYQIRKQFQARFQRLKISPDHLEHTKSLSYIINRSQVNHHYTKIVDNTNVTNNFTYSHIDNETKIYITIEDFTLRDNLCPYSDIASSQYIKTIFVTMSI